jgi:hypothetical protein
MRRFAPLLTLLAVVVLGGALLTVNLLGDPGNKNAEPKPAAAAAAPATVQKAESAPPAAPAPPAAVAEKAYAGRSSGNEVTVAIALKDGHAVGYICDGKKTEAWLEGSVTGSDVSLKSADGKSTIVGTVDEVKSLGTVAVGAKQWPFAANAASLPAGLYEGRVSVKGVLNRIGWIVLQDGTQTGLRRQGLEELAAPVLDPADPQAVTLEGVPVTVKTIGGGDTVVEP